MKCAYNQDVPVCLVTLPALEKARLAALAPEDPNNIRYRPGLDGKPEPYWPAGAVREITGPTGAVWHCQRGIAVPADDECANALGYTPEQLAQAKHVYQRILDGIHPEDFAQYDAGVMKGYDNMGNWIPGPNFDKYQAAQKAEQEKSDI